MDAIKKKMLAMKMDKENALDRAEQMEQKLRDTEEQKAKLEEDLNTLQKKYSNLENDFDKANEGLTEANTKLEASEKRVNEAPDENALNADATRALPDPAHTDTASHPRASSPTQPLDFIMPSGSGDPQKHSGVSSLVEDWGMKGPRETAVGLEYLGAELSQDSQLSASTLSLSQELSQGSQPELAAETTPTEGTNTPPVEGTKAKKKGHKKGKKKKVKSRDQLKESSPRSPASSATTSPVHSDSSQNTNCETKRDSVTAKHHKSGNNGSSNNKSSKHSRSKSSKSEKKTKKSHNVPRRPEPEGGNLPAYSASEFDRIINSNEPLFSDVDISGEDELNAPPPPQPHRQSRLRAAAITATAASGGGSFGVVGIFIPCSQLGMNSNTMIKYAIIGSELQNVFQVSNRVSEQNVELSVLKTVSCKTSGSVE